MVLHFEGLEAGLDIVARYDANGGDHESERNTILNNVCDRYQD